MLRELPLPELRSDFVPRLQHRVYRIDEEAAIKRDTVGSGTTAGAAVAVAALLVIAAWYPAFQERLPEVELPAIVVEDRSVAPASTWSGGWQGPTFVSSSPLREPSLWSESNALLYEHSTLGRRHRDPGVIQAGLR